MVGYSFSWNFINISGDHDFGIFCKKFGYNWILMRDFVN